MYEIIEKNQYGVLVKNTTNYGDCFFCKYEITQCNNRYKCINDSYYIPDSESEKLGSENPLMNTTIDDLYIESKCYFEVKKKLDDTQKELIDLQNENKQMKERIKELEGTIENMKAIACEKIEPINGVTSVDYQNDNETELITERENVFKGCFSEITKTKCCGIAPITNENYCPNCGRKIKK